MVAIKGSKADELDSSLTLNANENIIFGETDTSQFRLPWWTTSARDAASFVAGDVIWNSTTKKINVYNGTSWEVVTSS